MQPKPIIKKGDVVILKCGSPRMVVEYVTNEERVWADARCVWIYRGVVHKETFPWVLLHVI